MSILVSGSYSQIAPNIPYSNKAFLEMYFTPTLSLHPALTATSITVLAAHLLFNLPRRDTAVLLAGQRAIFRNTTELRPLLHALPKDPRTVVAKYNLEPVIHVRLCCPSCFCLYDYTPDSAQPPTCTHRPAREDPACGAPLWTTMNLKNKTLSVPCRKQVFQDLPHWISRLLARPGMEDLLENPIRRRHHYDEPMFDFWDAMASYRCVDRTGQPFFPGPDPKRILRLMFSFSVDGFNPFHMKEAKQTASSTGIWMALLNLPLHLRFRDENLFHFTILPGDRGPSMDQINHVLDFLVEHFLLPLFEPGFRLSRTAKYPEGRTIQGRIVPLLADMPAVRQAIGFSPQNSKYFCTGDLLPISDIENFDKSTWPPRILADLKKHAFEWRDAPTSKERKKLYEMHGIRYTPLWKLLYFDPIQMADMEPWHIFFLGLLQTYIRHTWGIDWKVDGAGDGTGLARAKIPMRPSNQIMLEWTMKIREHAKNEDEQGLIDALGGKACSKAISWHICNDFKLRTAGTKAQRAGRIAEYVRL